VDGAAESRKLGGTQEQKNAAIAAAKTGAPIEKRGGVSNKSSIMWAFSGGNKSAHSTWAQRATAGTALMSKGRSKGQPLGIKAASVVAKTKTFSQPIATHSHECKDPSCRQPVKIKPKTQPSGKQSINMNHRCLATKSFVGGLAWHLCSMCHKTGLVCRDKVCRGLQCTTSRSDCAHLHDGSGTPRK